ncbi:hypothetical protein PENSPDRAFT_656841 [Peniophora sp. CONT]|nr:hypothetical protein PENSPDRAFT_656841 [Peniophora sp. CONT]
MPSDPGHHVHKLPVDIVRLLFDHAAALDPPSRSPWFASRKRTSLGWIALTHVCRYWRDIGLAMPLLWASIATTFFDLAIANEFLVRACGCPITVDLTSLDGWRHLEGTLLPLIRENLPQVGVLKLPFWTLVHDVLHSGDEKPLPFLHTVQINGWYPYNQPWPYPLQTLQLHAPGLRFATLYNVILPPGSTRILRELDLTLSYYVRASLSTIHEFLRCCLQLEKLKMKWELRGPRLWLRDKGYHPSAIQLKKLKIVTLSVERQQMAWDLWQPIVAPDDIVLKIVCEKKDPALSRSTTPLLLELCAGQLSANHHDAIEFKSKSMTVYQLSPDRSPSSSSCTLSIVNLGHTQLLNTFPPFIRKENIRTLSLHAVNLVLSDVNVIFPALGCALPNVTDLSIKHLNNGPVSLYIRTLGRRTSAGSIFPALQVLRLSDIDLKGKSSNPARSTTQYWWDTLKATLKTRLDVKGEPLRCLVLEGTWPNARKWDVDQDGEELRECRSCGVVQEIHDYRTFTMLEGGARRM